MLTREGSYLEIEVDTDGSSSDSQSAPHSGARARARPAWRRWLPLAVLVVGLVAFFASGLGSYLSMDRLIEHRVMLTDLVLDHPLLTALGFVGLYALVVAFSLPVASPLTLFGGFLFGSWLGGAMVVVAATAGSVVVFLIARSAFGEALRARAGPFAKRLEAGFRDDAISYMLVLRLIPLFPFWLVNVVPALLNVPLRAYAIGTLVGIVPGTLVYAMVGNGLGAVLEAGDAPALDLIFNPEILSPILGLAALSMVPVIYKQIKRRREQ